MTTTISAYMSFLLQKPWASERLDLRSCLPQVLRQPKASLACRFFPESGRWQGYTLGQAPNYHHLQLAKHMFWFCRLPHVLYWFGFPEPTHIMVMVAYVRSCMVTPSIHNGNQKPVKFKQPSIFSENTERRGSSIRTAAGGKSIIPRFSNTCPSWMWPCYP